MSLRAGHRAVWLLLALGCGGPERHPVETPGKPMSGREVRKALTEAFANARISLGGETNQFAVNRRRAAIGFKNTPNKRIIVFAEISNLRLERYGDLWYAAWTQPGGATADGVRIGQLSFNSRETAQRFAELLLAARQAETVPSSEEADFATFVELAKGARPEMPDAARADKALAEDAFKKKDFAAALTAYEDALEKHPLWPEGQYNAALLAAEVEDFETAAHHMRRYLVLAPDAKDVPASKEKLLLWKLKAKS